MKNQTIPRQKEKSFKIFENFLKERALDKSSNSRFSQLLGQPPHVIHKGRKTINVRAHMAREYVGGFKRGSSE